MTSQIVDKLTLEIELKKTNLDKGLKEADKGAIETQRKFKEAGRVTTEAFRGMESSLRNFLWVLGTAAVVKKFGDDVFGANANIYRMSQNLNTTSHDLLTAGGALERFGGKTEDIIGIYKRFRDEMNQYHFSGNMSEEFMLGMLGLNISYDQLEGIKSAIDLLRLLNDAANRSSWGKSEKVFLLEKFGLTQEAISMVMQTRTEFENLIKTEDNLTKTHGKLSESLIRLQQDFTSFAQYLSSKFYGAIDDLQTKWDTFHPEVWRERFKSIGLFPDKTQYEINQEKQDKLRDKHLRREIHQLEKEQYQKIWRWLGFWDDKEKPPSPILSTPSEKSPHPPSVSDQRMPGENRAQWYSRLKARYSPMVDATADKYGIPRDVFQRLVKQESGYYPGAVSRAGAIGLTQVMPKTGAGMGYMSSDLYDPHKNLDAGGRYFKQMMTRYHGDITLAEAAYNAGPGAVDRAHGVPHIAETQDYVRRLAPIPSHSSSSKNVNVETHVGDVHVHTQAQDLDTTITDMRQSMESLFGSAAASGLF